MHLLKLLAPADDLRQGFFGRLSKKKIKNKAILAHFRPFLCTVVTLIMFIINLRNFDFFYLKKNKNKKKIKKKNKKI